MPAFLYNVSIEGDFGSVLIDWGNDPGWIKREAEHLEEAKRLSLIPKHPAHGLPVFTVEITVPGSYVLFSRVFGTINRDGSDNGQVRLYRIGRLDGTTEICTWVYPNGAAEIADDPTLWRHYITLAPQEGDDAEP